MANNALIGIAGVHYVVAELSRRGMIALPTVKNVAAYDIVALNIAGTKHANIQVKASSKRASFFPMPPPEKVRVGARDYYVLVRWLNREHKFEAFLLSGRAARAAVEENLELQRSRIREGRRKSLFPCVPLGLTNVGRARRWASAWEAWSL